MQNATSDQTGNKFSRKILFLFSKNVEIGASASYVSFFLAVLLRWCVLAKCSRKCIFFFSVIGEILYQQNMHAF